MSDAHRQLLDAVISAVTGLTSTGARVYEDPADAIQGDSFPSLVVEPQDVEAEPLGGGGDNDWLERHTIGVRISSIAETPAERDQSSLEVKTALVGAPDQAILRRFVRSSFSRSGTGDRPLVAIENRFEFTYLVDNTAPGAIRPN